MESTEKFCAEGVFFEVYLLVLGRRTEDVHMPIPIQLWNSVCCCEIRRFQAVIEARPVAARKWERFWCQK